MPNSQERHKLLGWEGCAQLCDDLGEEDARHRGQKPWKGEEQNEYR